MDVDDNETPQKQKSALWPPNGPSGDRADDHSSGGMSTPDGAGRSRKTRPYPYSPSGCSIPGGGGGSAGGGGGGGGGGSTSSFPMLSAAVVGTPPAKRFHRVRNPFESALADRLHLPLIASPSLFTRPPTPQLSSTQFEWTIDEVSSLKPVNVEPHETQFHDSPDPEYEAKAQSAISSFFKEHQIVPSPVDCPLRNRRIILSELNCHTPFSKPRHKIRDCAVQTDLVLPFELPKAVEDALRPYFQPHLAGCSATSSYDSCENRDSYATSTTTTTTRASVGVGVGGGGGVGTDVKDVSLRRKLFDMHNVVVLDDNNTPTVDDSGGGGGGGVGGGGGSGGRRSRHARAHGRNSNSSPMSVASLQRTAIVGKLSDSLDKSSLGSLSPISPTYCMSMSPSSQGSATKRKSRLKKFLHDLEDVEQLSPIHPPQRVHVPKQKKKERSGGEGARLSRDKYRMAPNTSEQTINDLSMASGEHRLEPFTPDRSSSPLRGGTDRTDRTDRTECLVDNSFNVKVSRLLVNSSQCTTGMPKGRVAASSSASSKDAVVPDLCMQDDTVDDVMDLDDDDMQVSQLSTRSSSSSSDTPRSKRRSASRKNLSRSFSTNWQHSPDDGDYTADDEGPFNTPRVLPKFYVELTEADDAGGGGGGGANGGPSGDASDGPGDSLSMDKQCDEQRLTFYRTDSGFNEMTSSQSLTALQPDSGTVRCSTPSKKRFTASRNY